MGQFLLYLNQDHPRIRGEYIVGRMGKNLYGGSPPHTRGIHKRIHAVDCRCGITPAYAGNTGNEMQPSTGGVDHPRIRGEYKKQLTDSLELQGSPPHTRGIPFTSNTLKGKSGITPAYAGNTVLPETNTYTP